MISNNQPLLADKVNPMKGRDNVAHYYVLKKSWRPVNKINNLDYLNPPKKLQALFCHQ